MGGRGEAGAVEARRFPPAPVALLASVSPSLCAGRATDCVWVFSPGSLLVENEGFSGEVGVGFCRAFRLRGWKFPMETLMVLIFGRFLISLSDDFVMMLEILFIFFYSWLFLLFEKTESLFLGLP